VTEFVLADVPTVLLVNLPHDDRAMYAEYLGICGFRAVEVDTTAEALRAAMTADVIVTDLHLQAQFDGVEFVRHLRDGQDTCDMPIIVLTACAYEGDKQRAFAAGCDRFLAKPCLPDRLVSEIRVVLSSRRRPESNDEERISRIDQMLVQFQHALQRERATLALKMRDAADPLGIPPTPPSTSEQPRIRAKR
jgi:two-component system cell cycle response regulator DivK